MPNSDTLITVQEVVDGIMFKSKLPKGESLRVKQLVLDGYMQLNLTTLKQGRAFTIYVIDSKYEIEMPSDLISVKDIFVPLDGQMWSLTRNRKIPILYNGRNPQPKEWLNGGLINTDYGVNYGAKGGRNTEGYYNLDYTNRRIIFRNTLDRSEVLLDYLSSGIVKDGITYIPEQAKLALEMFVLQQLSLYGILSANKYSMYEREFNKQKAILRLIDINFTEFSDTVYRTITSTFRR